MMVGHTHDDKYRTTWYGGNHPSSSHYCVFSVLSEILYFETSRVPYRGIRTFLQNLVEKYSWEHRNMTLLLSFSVIFSHFLVRKIGIVKSHFGAILWYQSNTTGLCGTGNVFFRVFHLVLTSQWLFEVWSISTFCSPSYSYHIRAVFGVRFQFLLFAKPESTLLIEFLKK